MKNLQSALPASLVDAGPQCEMTLEQAKAHPAWRENWAGRLVVIFSLEYQSYWAPNAAGYVKPDMFEGPLPEIWEFEAAFNRVSSCDPSKQIVFRALDRCVLRPQDGAFICSQTVKAAHEYGVKQGFWSTIESERPNLGEKIALIHSEASEALEVLRKGDLREEAECDFCAGSGKVGVKYTMSITDCPHCHGTGTVSPCKQAFGEELADIVIRVMDMAGFCDIDLISAVLEKMAKNRNRPFKHGKRF